MASGPLSLVPRRPGDAPFRNLLVIPENTGSYLAEAKREIQCSAVRQLEAMEEIYRKLVEQAQAVVAAAQRDLELHDFPVQATKIRGQIYHLYQREGRVPSRFFSILPPEDHAQADPRSRFLATYRLNEDSTWTRLDAGHEQPWIDEVSEG
jgi:hypothetical protein